MNIYRCHLELMEATFFSSREISNYYQTEPIIGNYALAYALGLCSAPYHNTGAIHYRRDLGALNEHGIYITPATLIGAPRFTLAQFNAQPDAYWYAMANNTIVTRPDGAWVRKDGSKWYVIREPGERGKAVAVENRPQHGRIRFLAHGNQSNFYIISREAYRPPAYIRLGKFMSKARLQSAALAHHEVEARDLMVPFLLNPNDLGPETTLITFDLVNVPPTPLIQNASFSGRFYRLEDGAHLPVDMRFGVQHLPED